jgi:hypothetical protein
VWVNEEAGLRGSVETCVLVRNDTKNSGEMSDDSRAAYFGTRGHPAIKRSLQLRNRGLHMVAAFCSLNN